MNRHLSGSDQRGILRYSPNAGAQTMTGQKDRYSTQEKLWKLDDEQLATPKHDELVLTLLNKNYSKNKFKEFLDDIIDISSEVPITTKNGFIVGYWDIVIKGISSFINNETGHKQQYGVYLYIECKPNIDSFGKVLRQLNTYIQYNGDIVFRNNTNKAILFTNDIRFKEAFESQNILVFSVDDVKVG